MIRVSLIILAVLVVLPALLLPPMTAGAAEGGEDNIYVVRPGDTLSGIAGTVLGDMKKWTEILEVNPQVTDPGMIYPGDALVLPTASREKPEGALAVSDGSEIGAGEKALYQQPPAEPQAPPVSPTELLAPLSVAEMERLLPVETVRPVPVINDRLYQTAGYIAKRLPETSIVASIASKISLVEGDEVILGTSADEGATFTVLRPVKKVHHPRTGAYMGWVLKIMGWAEVNCPGEENARAILLSTVDTVEVGDLVVPFDPEDLLENNTIGSKQSKFCLKKGKENFIVAAQEVKSMIASGDIVFLDQGRDAGVEPGDLFVVYRDVNPEGIDVIGQLQVLKTGAQTSTALVINSLREIEVSDFVQSWDPSAGG